MSLVVYVGLDLYLPAMPGAFVFDSNGSIETVEVARTRPAARIVVLAAPSGDACLLPRRAHFAGRPRLTPGSDVTTTPVVTHALPRDSCSASRLSEDSH